MRLVRLLRGVRLVRGVCRRGCGLYEELRAGSWCLRGGAGGYCSSFFLFGDSLLAVPFVRCCVVCQFVCALGLSVRQSVCLVLFRSFFLNFWTFVLREEELRAPYRRRRVSEIV